MSKKNHLTLSLLTLGALSLGSTARAEQKLRVQVDQRGDFLIIGNTLGWDCGAGAAAPLVGSVPVACGTDTSDTSSDLFWRADEPVEGSATASLAITRDQARSDAAFDLPAGATVTHAFLYWGARRLGSAADTSVTFERPGVFSQAVTADDSYVVPEDVTDVSYQSVADVTSLVRANGPGVYRVSGIDVKPFPNLSLDVLYAGWSLVVLYELESDPPRNLTVFDGLDSVEPMQSSSVSLSGFLVPNAGFDAKFGTIVYEGDATLIGDSLLFGTAPLSDDDKLSDALNAEDNFFNGSMSRLGEAVSHPQNLPRLSGLAGSMSGIDLDVIDVTDRMTAGQTAVDLRATSTLDQYYLGAFVTSIATFRPDFSSSEKTVEDVNGGVLLAGDVIEYTVTVTNSGNDDSTGTILTDPLPAGVTLVPGSVSVESGPNQGVKTEAADDDQASYDATNRSLTVNLGADATASEGGAIEVGASSSVRFRVTVDPSQRGVISNQAEVAARGARGAPVAVTLTDGDPRRPGVNTTDIPVAGCMSDVDCGGTTPYCDTSKQPPVCVQCTTDKQCPGPGSTCNTMTNSCQCGGLPMSCMDSDDDGLSDTDETTNGTDPADADSDDDGALDGQEPTPFEDSDEDGLIDALDPDSDDDALYDGTELGRDCEHAATDATLGHCRADGDRGATTTDPLVADSDGGGVRDGSEDSDLDGVLDPGERNPTATHGDDDSGSDDGDGDGLSDPLEDTLHSDPRDDDSDDDGLLDGEERNPADDTDGDGVVNVLDPDSDDDGLYDGTESGKDCNDGDTARGHCIADGDRGATTTSPVLPDTDRGGASDGSEDSDRDGTLDMNERDPTLGHGTDDTLVVDRDGDGLSDPVEETLGSDPLDADTDDDGVRDGDEANPGDDADGDGSLNVLDPDSDGDQLFDGTERGSDCSDPATDRAKALCVPDGDTAKSTTSMVNPDTDYGGVEDGPEDANNDGVFEPGERDPNNPLDDDAQMPDAGVDAGPPPEVDAGHDAGFGNDHRIAGGGCSCSVSERPKGMTLGDLLPLLVGGLFWMRRRRRPRAAV